MLNFKSVILLPVLILVILTICGCSSYAPMVEQGDIPSPEKAYVYGGFRLTADPGKLITQSGSIALVLASDETNTERRIRFQWDQEFSCFSVKPGCYYISKWISYGSFGSENLLEQDIRGHFHNNSFCLEPGKAYYLGDFISHFDHDRWGITHRYVHTLKIPSDNFVEQTAAYNQAFPEFIDMPKEKVFNEPFFEDGFNKAHILAGEREMSFAPSRITFRR